MERAACPNPKRCQSLQVCGRPWEKKWHVDSPPGMLTLPPFDIRPSGWRSVSPPVAPAPLTSEPGSGQATTPRTKSESRSQVPSCNITARVATLSMQFGSWTPQHSGSSNRSRLRSATESSKDTSARPQSVIVPPGPRTARLLLGTTSAREDMRIMPSAQAEDHRCSSLGRNSCHGLSRATSSLPLSLNPRGTASRRKSWDLLMAETAHDGVMHSGEEPFFADLEGTRSGLVLPRPLRLLRLSVAGRVCQSTFPEGPGPECAGSQLSARGTRQAPVQAVAHHGKGNLNASTAEVVHHVLPSHASANTAAGEAV